MFRSAPFLSVVLMLSTFTAGCGDKAQESIASKLAAAEATARIAKTPEAYIDLSLRYYESKKYAECAIAATEAARLKPESSVAYNNEAACYGALGKWDEEIAAAQQALRLSPEFQLARNNLAWAESQKKIGGSK